MTRMLQQLTALMAISAVGAAQTGPVAIKSVYDVSFDNPAIGFLAFVVRQFKTQYKRYMKIGMEIERNGDLSSVRLYDANAMLVGLLKVQTPKEGNSERSFIIDPDTNKPAAYSPDALQKIYSLFAYVMSDARKVGEPPFFVSFSYYDPEKRKNSYHGILLQISAEESSQYFRDVDPKKYGYQRFNAWRVEMWMDSRGDRELTQWDLTQPNKPKVYCNALVVNHGNLQGKILVLHANKNGYIAHLTLPDLKE